MCNSIPLHTPPKNKKNDIRFQQMSFFLKLILFLTFLNTINILI